jgi:flagellar basal-body rod protein FlgB
MRLDFLSDQTLDAMETYMTRLTQRQKVVAANLANIDTPGYKTKDVSFHATMQELMSTDSANLRSTRPEHNQAWVGVAPRAQAYEVQGLPERTDRNNVDLDREMLRLSETAFGYSLITQMVRGKFRNLATAINEGRA